MFSSQISSERSGAQQAIEVLGQEFLVEISPGRHMFMFYLLDSNPVGMTPTGKNFTVAIVFMRNEQNVFSTSYHMLCRRHIDQNMLAKLMDLIKDEEVATRFLEDVSVFWRTLETRVDVPQAHARDMDSKMRDLTSMLDQISTSPISKVRECRHLIKEVLCPMLPDDPCAPLTSPP
ncbi:hypothetical protein M9H77_08970 [Catharanthus roseus]|uniref:Uncharacterized protein n=1 Tax=Catharanthus roseus TaxID=4058 RepID=A0ACC0BZC8_CATRO|nr:hypothetical protein M9H77_08970 [Catharanthus roseus]